MKLIVLRSRSFIKILLVLVVSFISIIFSSFETNQRKKDNFFFFTLASYIQSQIHNSYAWFVNIMRTVNEYSNYKDKINSYEKKVHQLELMTQNIQVLRQENIALKEQLKFYQTDIDEFVTAQVIHLSFSNISSLMTINKGYNDGLEKNMVVITYQDGFSGLVGKLIKVFSNTAKVLLVTNNENFISARIQNSKFIGLIEGKGKGNFLAMHYVNKLAEEGLRIGDSVVTAGFGEYPSGIYIGKIKSFRLLTYNALLDITVEPAVVFDKLEYIFVIKKIHKEGD